ncbi:MAG: hypothetical protein ABI197_06855 [Granulicella sp.]
MVDFKVICCAPVALCLPLLAQQERIYETSDIMKVPTLYVVPYAHLDTQWRLDASARFCMAMYYRKDFGKARPDGSKIIAALNPTSYNSNVYTDLSK